MCFSAKASFTAAVVIGVIGTITLCKAREKKLQPFAAIPLFFALQQAFEGLVWITLNTGNITSLVHKIGVYGYIFFASIFWPIWIPGSLYILEQDHIRKKFLLGAIIIGVIVALVYALSFIMMGRTALILDSHITYLYHLDTLNINIARYMGYLEKGPLSLYFIATVVSLFISSVPRIWILGLFVALGFVVAQLFYLLSFGSVWCFFAAIASTIIYYIVIKNSNR